MATENRRSVIELVTTVIAEVTGLMQTELRLIRVEASEKIGQLANGAVMIGGGAVLLIAGLGIAFLAVAEWLVIAGLPREWALTLVAVCGVAIGAVLALRGVRNIKTTEIVPERSLHSVRKDFNTIKDHVS